MQVLVSNKHYEILVDPNSFLFTGNGVKFHYELTLKTTRATKYQAKKLLARKLIRMLRTATRTEDYARN